MGQSQTRGHSRLMTVVLALALAAAMAVFAACGSDDDGGASTGGDGGTTAAASGEIAAPPECNQIRAVPEIAVERAAQRYRIVNLQAHRLDSFANTIAWGAAEEAKRLGVSLRTLDAGGYQFPQKQMAQLQAAITQRADAVMIWATDINAVVPLVRQAREAGIVVVGYVQVPDTELDAVLKSDDEQETYDLVTCIAKAMGERGQFSAVYGVAGSTYQGQLKRGLNRALDEFPEIELVGEHLIPDVDPAKTQNIIQNELQRHPDLRGVFGTVMTMADGAAQAISAAGKTGQVALGASNIASPEAADMLESGAYTVIGGQQPALYGKLALDQVVALLEGQELSAEQRDLTMRANIYTNPDDIREQLPTELAPQFR